MTDDPHFEAPPEPSVLDYIKSRLSPGRHAAVEIPVPERRPSRPAEGSAEPATVVFQPTVRENLLTGIPWRSLTALGMALVAQSLYEPPAPRALAGTVLYVLAGAMLAWAA